MNREQPNGVSKKISKGIFKPWPPENKFKHVMAKENFIEIAISADGPKEIAARKAKARREDNSSEMIH